MSFLKICFGVRAERKDAERSCVSFQRGGDLTMSLQRVCAQQAAEAGTLL